MFRCKKCKGQRIKTRTNKSFGKSITTAICCKDCDSTEIENVNIKMRRRYWKRK
jgi:hypothetical protein